MMGSRSGGSMMGGSMMGGSSMYNDSGEFMGEEEGGNNNMILFIIVGVLILLGGLWFGGFLGGGDADDTSRGDAAPDATNNADNNSTADTAKPGVGSSGPVWQWQDKSGKWHPYKAGESKQIDDNKNNPDWTLRNGDLWFQFDHPAKKVWSMRYDKNTKKHLGGRSNSKNLKKA